MEINPHLLQTLPAPLTQQIGAYLRKEISAYCLISSYDKKTEEYDAPPERNTNKVHLMYSIWRNGKLKFRFWTYGFHLRTWEFEGAECFLEAKDENYFTIDITKDEENILSIAARPKNDLLTVNTRDKEEGACMADTSFTYRYYKPAFDTLLKDLWARHKHLQTIPPEEEDDEEEEE